MAQPDRRARFGIDLSPLSTSKALALFGALYVASVVGWKNLPQSTANDLRNYWAAFLVPGAVLGIALARVMWNLLSDFWFGIALAVAVAMVSLIAAAKLHEETAYPLVYHTAAFVIPLAVLAASLAMSMAALPWGRKHSARMLLQAGLLVLAVATIINVTDRRSGTVTVAKGQPQSVMALNDYVVTFVSDEGAWTRVALPIANPFAGRCRKAVEAGSVSVQIAYEGDARGSNAIPLAVTASDGTNTKTLSLCYNGGFTPLAIGKSMHRMAFGPSKLGLPFEITVDYAGDESLGTASRTYDAAVTFTDRQSGKRSCAALVVGRSVSAFGCAVRLISVERPNSVTLAVVTRPALPAMSAGALLVLLSAVVAAWSRWMTPAKSRLVLSYCRAIVS